MPPVGPPADCEGRGGPGLDAMAEVIGIDVEELHTALEDGQTPAEVAEANGVSRADLVDAIVADITSHIEQARRGRPPHPGGGRRAPRRRGGQRRGHRRR